MEGSRYITDTNMDEEPESEHDYDFDEKIPEDFGGMFGYDDEKFRESKEEKIPFISHPEIFDSGYPRDCFPSSVSEDFICGICHEVARNPFNLSCSHLFCENCLTRMIKSGQKSACPICRIVFNSNLQYSSYSIKIISSLPIRCPHHEKGCSWTGTIGFQESVLMNHLKNVCEWGGFEKCKKCDAQIRKDEIQNHDLVCRESEGKCEFCDFRGPNKAVFVHKAIGKYSQEPCASTQHCNMHQCDVLIPKNDLQKHLKTQCNKLLRICYGCEKQHYMPKWMLKDHIKEKQNDPEWMKRWINGTTGSVKDGDLRYLGIESATYDFESGRTVSLICEVVKVARTGDVGSVMTRCIPGGIQMVNYDIYTGPPPHTMNRRSNKIISDLALDCLNHHECSYKLTGNRYIEQPFYNCKTCSGGPNTGVCAVCAVDCHFGHDLQPSQSSERNFCDCSTGDIKLVGIKQCRAASHVRVNPKIDRKSSDCSELYVYMIIRGNLTVNVNISFRAKKKNKKKRHIEEEFDEVELDR